jgi:hypothetical protein
VTSGAPSGLETLPAVVNRLRWDRRRDPRRGHREYSRAAREALAVADGILTRGDPREARALGYLDDSSGVIGQDLHDLMGMYARACHAAPPAPARLAAWLVELACDGPGWPEVALADFAPALGADGLARVADLVTERLALTSGD